MPVKRQKQRDAEMSTLEPNAPYPPGLRILARMIACSYLEEKQAQCLQKDKNSGANQTPEGVRDNESWQVSNDGSRSSNNGQ